MTKRVRPRSKYYDLGYLDGFSSGMMASSAAWLLALVDHPPALTAAMNEMFSGVKELVEAADESTKDSPYRKARKKGASQ